MRQLCTLLAVAFAAAALAVPTAAQQQLEHDPAAQAGVVPVVPSLRPEDIVGQWGLVGYVGDEDRARAEDAARRQCIDDPYVIRAAGAGVMMGYPGHDRDVFAPQEMTVKSNSEGKTFIVLDPEPGGVHNFEVVSFDGRTMILKRPNPEYGGRYFIIMKFVRCGPGEAPPP